MRQTETTINWPSKLKIGAKSKKGAFASALIRLCLVVGVLGDMPCGWPGMLTRRLLGVVGSCMHLRS